MRVLRTLVSVLAYRDSKVKSMSVAVAEAPVRTPEVVREPARTEYQYPGIPTTCDGAEAVVHVEIRVSQAAGAYPITSSTTMGGGFNAAVMNGKKNLWGDTLLFFFAGHGSRQDGKDYFLFSDSDPADLTKTALSLDTVSSILNECKATQRVYHAEGAASSIDLPVVPAR